MEKKEQLVIDPVPAANTTVGRWLATMDDCRLRTKEVLSDLPPGALDFQPDGYVNSIGTLLYHIGAIEADWLYAEILEEEFSSEIVELFPHDVRTEEGRLMPITGGTLSMHLERLDLVRGHLTSRLQSMTLEEFRRPRDLPAYLVSPEWVLHHLMQHEAGHRGEIVVLRALARASSA